VPEEDAVNNVTSGHPGSSAYFAKQFNPPRRSISTEQEQEEEWFAEGDSFEEMMRDMP